MPDLKQIFGEIMSNPLNENFNNLKDKILEIFNVKADKSTVNSQVSNLQNNIDSTNSRVDNILNEQDLNPNKDQELVDIRHSLRKNITYDSAGERINAGEIENKFFWEEFHTVEAGESSFTLTNTVQNYQKLHIIDTKYPSEWLEGEEKNYTIDGQIVTLPVLTEDLVFRVRAI